MASYGKVLDLLDGRYLDLQDVIGNVEPLPTLVPYENYAQNVLVYRMDTSHEVFLGLIQDFTYRRAHELQEELWTWLVQWEVNRSPPVQQPLPPKKLRLEMQQAATLFKEPSTPRKLHALTIFERRTFDGALMLEEDMLRILIDIVQVASSLVPNFIEFLYRWIDYYEGDGKALKAALRWEIPSLWDFEYHPLLLTRDGDKERKEQPMSVSASRAAELRHSSPTKKMHARPKPDVAAIELQTFYVEESERLQYREVKFGTQPPKVEEPLTPLINIPRDVQKRTKYFAACFKSRQRALYLLQEAGITIHQIDNYQKLQTAHPRETPETTDGIGNGLRNYQKDSKYAQAHYKMKEQQTKQREISISNKLAVEAQLAATHAVPDGAAGLPLIPPTPSNARKLDMAAEMMRKIKRTRAHKDDGKINRVPKSLLGLMKSEVFAGARNAPKSTPDDELKLLRGTLARSHATDDSGLRDDHEDQDSELDYDTSSDEDAGGDSSSGEGDSGSDNSDDGGSHEDATVSGFPRVTSTLPRPTLPMSLSLQLSSFCSPLTSAASTSHLASSVDRTTPPDIASFMQNLNTEQVQRLLPLLSSQARQAASSRLRQSLNLQNTTEPSGTNQLEILRTPIAPVKQPASQWTPLHSSPSPHQADQDHYRTRRMDQGQTTSSSPSLVAGLLLPPRQRASNAAQNVSQTLHPQQAATMPVSSSGGPQSPTVSEGSRSIPAYALALTTAAQPITLVHTPALMSPSFDPEVFMLLRHRQEAMNPLVPTEGSPRPDASPTVEQLVREPSLGVATELSQQMPSQCQRMLSETFHAGGAVTQNQIRADLTTQGFPDPTSIGPTLTVPAQPSTSGAMLPPSRPGIARNAPSPLSLSPPKPSPFNTMTPQMLATSPFLATPVDLGTPIQIYLPKIVVPGKGIGPGGTRMGDHGCIETDALMLGHMDSRNGSLVLTKAILLPVGVWENTLRKVRNGRWTVLETYACPLSHPAKVKGKGKVGEESTGCHKVIYDKLAQTYRMMSPVPLVREDELTKRWRTSRGPMTSSNRGAVWEGWGVYVDRAMEMSTEARQGAMKNEAQTVPKVGEGGDEQYGPYSEPEENLRRRKEMDELMDEDADEDMDGQFW